MTETNITDSVILLSLLKERGEMTIDQALAYDDHGTRLLLRGGAIVRLVVLEREGCVTSEPSDARPTERRWRITDAGSAELTPERIERVVRMARRSGGVWPAPVRGAS